MDDVASRAVSLSTWHGQTVSRGSQTIQLRLVKIILEIRRWAQDTCDEPDLSQYDLRPRGARLREHPTEDAHYRNRSASASPQKCNGLTINFFQRVCLHPLILEIISGRLRSRDTRSGPRKISLCASMAAKPTRKAGSSCSCDRLASD